MTLRDKDLLRKAMGDTTAVHAHRKRPRRVPTYPSMPPQPQPPIPTHSRECWRGRRPRRQKQSASDRGGSSGGCRNERFLDNKTLPAMAVRAAFVAAQGVEDGVLRARE